MEKYIITGLFVLTSLCSTYAQTTLSGVPGSNNCVFGGNSCYYQINDYPGANTSDKWCITGGTIAGSTNTCVTNVGTNAINVTWGTGSVGTVSYYRPSSAATPTATYNVTILNSAGTITFSGASYTFPYIPGNVPVNVTLTGTALNTCGVMQYKWQTSADGNIFTDIPGANSKDYVLSGTFSQDVYFKRLALVYGDVSLKASVTVKLLILPPPIPGIISPASTLIAINTTAPVLTASSPSGGQCGSSYTYTWESSPDNTNWSPPIPGAIGTQYSPGTLSVTTYFRQKVTCSLTSANTASVVIFVLDPGSIAAPTNNTLPYNYPPGPITTTNPKGGGPCNNNYIYQWQSSTDNSVFTDIPGATTAKYTPDNLITTTYYRREVTCGTLSVYSNTCVISVAAPFFAGTISPAASTVSLNQSLTITGTAATGGTCEAGMYTWQYSDDNINWVSINGPALSTTGFTTPPLTSKTWFRRVDRCGIEIRYTNSVVGNVLPGLDGGQIIPYSYEIKAGKTPGVLTANPASGGSGSDYTYQWEQSTNGGATFQAISGATQLTYTPGAITTTTIFRRKTSDSGTTAYTNLCRISVGDASQNINYVRRRNVKIGGIATYDDAAALTDPNQVGQVTEYFDGLGRAVQTVVKQGATKANGQPVDLVSFYLYDEFNRPAANFLPYAANDHYPSGSNNGQVPLDDGNYKINPLGEMATFVENISSYQNDNFIYGRTVFEASPLNRTLKQGAVGITWQPDAIPADLSTDKAVKHNYLANATSEVYLFTYNETAGSVALSYYDGGTLYKHVTKDEHTNEVVEYTDKEGHTVCKKVQYGTDSNSNKLYACTYYVYDDYGKLILVLPPEVVKALIN